MILSVSRRTDIPAFYAEWFFNRVKEGFAYVRNPMNVHQISKVPINTDTVDCIVLWSKNPAPMLERLHELDPYNYYFQFTLNPYNKELEAGVPRKNSIIDTFRQLSDQIGSKRVVWRYDPILMTHEIDIDYHIRYFEAIASKLATYTEKCMISFIDHYDKTNRNLKDTTVRSLNETEIFTLTERMSGIAKAYHIPIQTCVENIDLKKFGITQGSCIDKTLIESITGYSIASKKDKNQRQGCNCIESIDIGEYNTCLHNCLYCYATINNAKAQSKR